MNAHRLSSIVCWAEVLRPSCSSPVRNWRHSPAYLCNGIPTLCYALCLIGIGLIFNLDKKKTDQMYAEMAARRAAAEQE